MRQSGTRRCERVSLLAILVALVAIGTVPGCRTSAAPAGPVINTGLLAPDTSRGPGVVRITTLREKGGRLAWSKKTNLIALDNEGEDGYFDVYLMNPDGSNFRCLTCDHPDLPNKHIGNPAWHPSGRYLVFQAQNRYKGIWKVTDFFANPGSGVNNDVWIMDVETRRVWQVTQVEPKQGGVLHPHFSHDGNRLFWSERVSSKGAGWGTWVLKVADVRFEDDGPRVRSIETLKPADRDAWYEAHGFSPDDDSVIFTGNLEPDQKEMYCDIYRLNLSSRTLERLTRTLDQWDEHAHYTPGGRHILWMSSSGVGSPSSPWKVRTDYWVMNSDGSKKRRLTYFNEKGHRHEIPGGAIAADSAWSPDGKRLAAYLILSFKPHRAVNVMIEFNEPL